MPQPRTAIFVTGIGRTGASAAARLFSFYGGALPKRLLAPQRANAFGYWESQAAADLNDRFLAAFGSSWSDPRIELQLRQEAPGDMQKRFVDGIVKILETGFEPGSTIIVKDPRITGLLSFWLEASRRAGYNPVVVQTIRNPRAVAASLRVRNNMPIEYAAALWMKYNLIGERDSRRVRRAFVAYEDLMSDWHAAMAQVLRDLDLALQLGPGAEREAGDFISADLWHHRDESPIDCVPNAWVDRIYDWLLRTTRDERPDSREMDEIFYQYALAQRLVSVSFNSYMPPPAYPF